MVLSGWFALDRAAYLAQGACEITGRSVSMLRLWLRSRGAVKRCAKSAWARFALSVRSVRLFRCVGMDQKSGAAFSLFLGGRPSRWRRVDVGLGDGEEVFR